MAVHEAVEIDEPMKVLIEKTKQIQECILPGLVQRPKGKTKINQTISTNRSGMIVISAEQCNADTNAETLNIEIAGKTNVMNNKRIEEIKHKLETVVAADRKKVTDMVVKI